MRTRGLCLLALWALAVGCSRPEASAGSPAPAAVATQTTAPAPIDFVSPRPDSVGGTPARFEWTAVPGADSYVFGLWTETDQLLVKQNGLTTTYVLWPEGSHLDPGTYYWSVVAFSGSTGVASSGLAAFVVQ